MREIEPFAGTEIQIAAALVFFGIVLLDEAAGSTHQELGHQLLPIIEKLRLFERVERRSVAFTDQRELGFSDFFYSPHRADTQVGIRVDE